MEGEHTPDDDNNMIEGVSRALTKTLSNSGDRAFTVLRKLLDARSSLDDFTYDSDAWAYKHMIVYDGHRSDMDNTGLFMQQASKIAERFTLEQIKKSTAYKVKGVGGEKCVEFCVPHDVERLRYESLIKFIRNSNWMPYVGKRTDLFRMEPIKEYPSEKLEYFIIDPTAGEWGYAKSREFVIECLRNISKVDVCKAIDGTFIKWCSILIEHPRDASVLCLYVHIQRYPIEKE